MIARNWKIVFNFIDEIMLGTRGSLLLLVTLDLIVFLISFPAYIAYLFGASFYLFDYIFSSALFLGIACLWMSFFVLRYYLVRRFISLEDATIVCLASLFYADFENYPFISMLFILFVLYRNWKTMRNDYVINLTYPLVLAHFVSNYFDSNLIFICYYALLYTWFCVLSYRILK